MPRRQQFVPKLRRRRGRQFKTRREPDQAAVCINGKVHYLGDWGSDAAAIEYARLIAEWKATQDDPAPLPAAGSSMTVGELLLAYIRHAKGYYRKNGKRTSQYDIVKAMARFVKASYLHWPVDQFGPRKLEALRGAMIESGAARPTVNRYVGQVKAMFRWGASQEFFDVRVLTALETLQPLRQGRCDAPEVVPIGPVPDSVVELTIAELNPVVADMVRLQRLTGMRPIEVCTLTPGEIDRRGNVWRYAPTDHKTAHHGRVRIIFIGPRAQALLQPYLQRDDSLPCFGPPSGGEAYSTASYRRCIHRACDRVFVPTGDIARRKGESIRAWEARLSAEQLARLHDWRTEHRWSPNQLRHSAATEIRAEYGLEGAQVMLGHSKADITQVYAERNTALGEKIATEFG